MADCATCSGTGTVCHVCDLIEDECECQEPDLDACNSCDGTGEVEGDDANADND